MSIDLIQNVFNEKREIYAWFRHGEWLLKIDLIPDVIKQVNGVTRLSFFIPDSAKTHLNEVQLSLIEGTVNFFSNDSETLFQATLVHITTEQLVVENPKNIEYSEKRKERRFDGENYKITIIGDMVAKTFTCFDISQNGFSLVVAPGITLSIKKGDTVNFKLSYGKNLTVDGSASCVNVSKIQFKEMKNMIYRGRKFSFVMKKTLPFELEKILGN